MSRLSSRELSQDHSTVFDSSLHFCRATNHLLRFYIWRCNKGHKIVLSFYAFKYVWLRPAWTQNKQVFIISHQISPPLYRSWSRFSLLKIIIFCKCSCNADYCYYITFNCHLQLFNYVIRRLHIHNICFSPNDFPLDADSQLFIIWTITSKPSRGVSDNATQSEQQDNISAQLLFTLLIM